jgi:hypothetical protein
MTRSSHLQPLPALLVAEVDDRVHVRDPLAQLAVPALDGDEWDDDEEGPWSMEVTGSAAHHCDKHDENGERHAAPGICRSYCRIDRNATL